MKIITTNRFRSLCAGVGRFALVFASMVFLLGIVGGWVIVMDRSLTLWMDDAKRVFVAEAALPIRIALALSFNGCTGTIFLFGLTLWRLLRTYAKGLYFDATITRAYSRLAALACALWVMENLANLIAFQMPASSPMSWVNFIFTADYSELFLAVVLLILAQVMGEGARVQEEQSLTI